MHSAACCGKQHATNLATIRGEFEAKHSDEGVTKVQSDWTSDVEQRNRKRAKQFNLENQNALPISR